MTTAMGLLRIMRMPPRFYRAITYGLRRRHVPLRLVLAARSVPRRGWGMCFRDWERRRAGLPEVREERPG